MKVFNKQFLKSSLSYFVREWKMLRQLPLIVILGSTGTGKTKLSLELAERYKGEIISADSMQVYANLDIATAKATKEEQERAKHHLLDVATPATAFTVVHFRNAALPIIEELLTQSKCPIVVGGTNYYIESLLWDVLMPSSTCSETTKDSTKFQQHDSHEILLSDEEMSGMSSNLLHDHLKLIDPQSANRIHPNNKRKIMRAIEVYQQTGEMLSAKLERQRSQPGGNRLGGPLRYSHTILFWLRCNQEVLDARLDRRVDNMLRQGLLQELRAFFNHHCPKSDKGETCYTQGVLQTIGFKEFIPYLERFNEDKDEEIQDYLKRNDYKMPTNVEKNESQLRDSNEIPVHFMVLNECLNELKLVTRRYSKKQIKWINNRFLGCKERQVPDLYELDTSDVTKWNENVLQRAISVIDAYKNNAVSEIQPMPKRVHPSADLNEETSHFCELCERHFIGEFQWHIHLKSNKHKKKKEAKNKRQKTTHKS